MLVLHVEAGAGVVGHIIAGSDDEEQADLTLWRLVRPSLDQVHALALEAPPSRPEPPEAEQTAQ